MSYTLLTIVGGLRYDYITRELPQVLHASDLPLDLNRSSVFGHSMGGHGALTIYLRRLNSTNAFRSASAFAPICNPTLAPWGEKAFAGYLTDGVEEGKEWDATELISKVDGKNLHILADVVSYSFSSLRVSRCHD